MKTWGYIIFTFFIIVFSGCASGNNRGRLVSGPAAGDIVNYVNQGLIAIAELEQKSLESYASVTGENASTNKKLFEMLRDFIVPTYKRFATGLKNIKIENQEVRQVHAIYVKASEAMLEGFQTIMIGSEKGDDAIIKQGNIKLEEGQAGIEKWHTELGALYKKHGVAEAKKIK